MSFVQGVESIFAVYDELTVSDVAQANRLLSTA